jgi:hypothetical protein
MTGVVKRRMNCTTRVVPLPRLPDYDDDAAAASQHEGENKKKSVHHLFFLQ